MGEIVVAVVKHVYKKIHVAVLDVYAPVEIGDTLRIVSHKGEFFQLASSLAIKGVSVDIINKGDAATIKVDRPVSVGDLVYKMVTEI